MLKTAIDALRSYLQGPPDEWLPMASKSPKRLVTGELSSAPALMRKRVNGVWCYRIPTEEEWYDHVSADAW